MDSSLAAAPPKIAFHWLRNRQFDSFFIGAPLLLATLAGLVCVQWPALFLFVLSIDLWALGYHHVISTYTRIAFDRKSIRQHKFLVTQLPFLVLATTVLLAYGMGKWIIPTVYLYWQWFHYTRQSYGISRYYLARANQRDLPHAWLHTLALYGLPITGILHRSNQAPALFLGMPLKVFPVPEYAVMIAGAVTCAAIVLQALFFLRRYYRGATLPGAYLAYMASHHVIFALGYLLIDDINTGWLSVNIWHNMQYIAFVWHHNNQRFSKGIDPEQAFISKLSQNGKLYEYIVTCLGLTLLVYFTLQLASVLFQSYSALSIALILFMAINFHHYIVDAVIWRRKKPALPVPEMSR